MTRPPTDQDWLDELLGNDDYIEDKGFSARVMGTLPPRAPSPAWRRPILLAATFLACLVGVVILPGGAYLVEILQQASSYTPARSQLPLVPLLVLLLLAGGGVAAALHED